MRLRTLAGSRAGEIEEYSYEAGRTALAAGFAERVDRPEPVAVAVRTAPVMAGPPPAATTPTSDPAARRPRSRRR